MEITLTEVTAKDEICIRTQKSEYLFRVNNPDLCSGVLTGGLLGREHRSAFLAGAIFPGALRISDSKKLQTGARAIFYLEGKRGVDRLTTSVIIEIVFTARRREMAACQQAA
jgi:hypothetical protein